MSEVSDTRGPRRANIPEVTELQNLKNQHPELAPAADMHLELLALERRVLARVAQPWIEITDEIVMRHNAEGQALVKFEKVPLDMTDLRLLVRRITDILLRYDALDTVAEARLERAGRDADLLGDARRWYAVAADPPRNDGPETDDALAQVLALAMRPFLLRCASAVQATSHLHLWTHPRCPACGGEPELAVITPAAERHLVCGRCALQWHFDALTCPFCGNNDRARITSFATSDGKYRVAACERCRRYLKAYDGRHSTRGIMPIVETVAMLPLDAAAIQKGYTG
jgi:formate dehydrogenase maturation protein FdhE